MKILPKPEFERFVYERDISQGVQPEDAAFHAISTSGIHLLPENEIVVSNSVNTKGRLHEIGHKELGRPKLIDDINETVSDVAYNEILAEKFAWERMGKPITYRVGYPALLALNYVDRLSPVESVAVVISVLKKMGVPVTSQNKQEFKKWLRGYERVV